MAWWHAVVRLRWSTVFNLKLDAEMRLQSESIVPCCTDQERCTLGVKKKVSGAVSYST